MVKILEELQNRVAESKVRLDVATKTFQTAQANYQQAQQENAIWTGALQAEMREEQRKASAAVEKQLSLPTAQPEPRPEIKSKPEAEVFIVDPSDDHPEALNKTDTVRDLLRRHPAGMTAVDIWGEVSADFKHRPYLYSVLKRLRDREEIKKVRNKYCLKLTPKAEEGQESSVVH